MATKSTAAPRTNILKVPTKGQSFEELTAINGTEESRRTIVFQEVEDDGFLCFTYPDKGDTLYIPRNNWVRHKGWETYPGVLYEIWVTPQF